MQHSRQITPLRFGAKADGNDPKELWRLVLRDMLGDIEPACDSPLDDTPGLFFARLGLSLTTLYLPAAPVRFRASGLVDSGLVIMRAMEGPLIVEQRQRRAEASEGDVIFATADSSLTIALPKGGRLDCAYLPAHVLSMSAKQLAAILMQPISQGCLPLQLLITYAGYMLQQQRQNDSHADMMVRHFYQLLPVLVAELAADAARANSPDRLTAIKAAVAANLSDSAFSIADVARLQGVSTRAVQKLLQRTGTTFSRYLLERRLDAAKEALMLREGGAPITQLAFDFGFDDPAYFSRAFRKRYGLRPSDLRQSARNAKAPLSP
ncbi:UNVERIFIED_ORG: AraC family transcriptional regulator (plasmid) [Roseateles sp. XES5]|nr:AraC family transcriptional regulator [Roseateles sp. XES5]